MEIPEKQYTSEENEVNPCWQRIQMVLQTSGIATVNALAQYLGLKRSENLYQIKKGNYRISQKLARTINLHFNAFPVPWLLWGESEQLDANYENDIVSLPLYMQNSGQILDTGNVLNLSSTLCREATLALRRSENTITRPTSTVLLLKVPEKRLPDRVYYLQTDQFILGRITEVSPGTIIVRHKTGGQSVIETKDIKTIYEVCNILPTGLK